MMYDPAKLQCYTMSSRMRGFAEGLEDKYKYEALIYMLNKAADLLEDVWIEYQATLPEDKRLPVKGDE